jgi:hypothetical protein
MDWTGLATLVAALAAAVLSGLALFLTGRREDLKWKREVLSQAMVSLFDASFAGAYEAAFEARQAGEKIEEHKELALDLHAIQLRALTRMRFLAKPAVVTRAFELHDIEDSIYGLVFVEELKAERWTDLVARRKRLAAACTTQRDATWVFGAP